MDVINNRMLRQAIPLFNVLAVVLLILGLGALLVAAKDVFIHLALGLLLSFALGPIVRLIERAGLGRGLAVTFAILIAMGVIGGLIFVSYWQATGLAADMPKYEPVIREKIQGFSRELSAPGAFSNAADALARILAEVQNIGASSSNDAAQIVRIEDPGNAFESLYHVLEPLLHPIATFFVVMLLAAFMLAAREDLRNRVIRLAGPDDIQQTTFAIDDAGRRVGRLLLTQLAVNMAFGLAIGAGLWMIGLPSPFLWGILAGVLRFVPYVGAVIGLVPPLFVAFAVDPGWGSLVWTIGLFAVIEPLVGHVIEPLLYGHSAGISPVAILVAATVWAFLWGPVGLVLSTPLTVCLVVLGRHVRRLQFLDVLLGDRPALAPYEILYQRMLASDPHEAVMQARQFLQGRSLSTYYDEVALAALRRAHQDIVRGSVTDSRLDALVRSTEELVSALGAMEPRAADKTLGVEAEAALESVRLDHESELRSFQPQELKPSWRGQTPIAVLHGEHPLDGVAAHMLAQVFSRRGLAARAMPLDRAAEASAQEAEGTALVCLSFIEPLSTLHLRAYSIAARRRAPDAKVMLCIWQDTHSALIAELRRKLRVDHVATTMSNALEWTGRVAAERQTSRAATPRQTGARVRDGRASHAPAREASA
jgi:predicted PurR-regulated permease PerM